ncbi:hypothetical protein M878_44125 [Streptomyces roseochromogenus subsp. oscitans DS 12.976]|uniref:Uncharacterized protein n=1 Tax=Streptomyces roseochromogenus subsp. oscitans DS 12.976 TaxID=1352936 RepID=V6JID9_STRRC|nr:hypothetical protein M878_44125 [Streptomyces roseochromogenus subsp. oscitans DS 12.976]
MDGTAFDVLSYAVARQLNLCTARMRSGSGWWPGARWLPKTTVTSRAGQDDLARAACRSQVGEVAAERKGVVQAAVKAPAGQASARGDPVEHQPTDDVVPVLCAWAITLEQRAGVVVKRVGVGEQVPARPGADVRTAVRCWCASARGRRWCGRG